jgi:hypothetical protein
MLYNIPLIRTISKTSALAMIKKRELDQFSVELGNDVKSDFTTAHDRIQGAKAYDGVNAVVNGFKTSSQARIGELNDTLQTLDARHLVDNSILDGAWRKQLLDVLEILVDNRTDTLHDNAADRNKTLRNDIEKIERDRSYAGTD